MVLQVLGLPPLPSWFLLPRVLRYRGRCRPGCLYWLGGGESSWLDERLAVWVPLVPVPVVASATTDQDR